MVLVVWLFVVFVLTSSYTASLTSMLTVPILEPNVTNIELIKKTNATVGCDEDSFVKDYLRNVLELQNIKTITKQSDYPEEFRSGNIRVSFLELPYQKVFLNEYCNQYTTSGPIYRFGGQGFAFQKGSPIAADVSQAILTLSENGRLQELEKFWLGSSVNCSNPDETTKTESLGLESFWILFLISAFTSTICFFLFLLRHWRSNRHRHGASGGNVTTSGNTVWDKTVRLARSFHNGRPSFLRGQPNVYEWGSSRWELVSPSDISQGFEASQPAEIEIPVRT